MNLIYSIFQINGEIVVDNLEKSFVLKKMSVESCFVSVFIITLCFSILSLLCRAPTNDDFDYAWQ